MPANDPRQRKLLSQRAIAVRWGHTRVAEEAEREVRGLQLEDHVRRALTASPPLTADQRMRLCSLLIDGGDAA